MFRKLRVVFDVCWVAVWTFLFIHYGELMYVYGNQDYHVVYPFLYIAIEWWCLFSLVLIMMLLYKTLRDVESLK